MRPAVHAQAQRRAVLLATLQTESLPSASVKMAPLWEGEQHGHRRSVQAEAAAITAAKAATTAAIGRPTWCLIE